MPNARDALATRRHTGEPATPPPSPIRARKPTGIVPWPLILIEGGEKAGKSWAAAELTASPRVGTTYWLDLGEGAGDEYGAIPGAQYMLIEHDGSWADVYAQVEAVRAEATRAHTAGEPPIVLVFDSMSAEWELLKGIADMKARRRLAKKGRAVKADEEPDISMDIWNEVNGKHRRLMTMLMTFPGIVVMTARGKEVAALDSGGRPIQGSKEYKVEGQKNLGYDATVWVRVSRDHPPVVVGARSVHAGVQPGVDKPRPVPGLTLERVIFDVLKCDPGTAHVRDMPALSTDEADRKPVVSPQQRMFDLFKEADITDRQHGVAYISETIGREVKSTADLTVAEVQAVVERLERFVAGPQEPSK